MRLFIAGPSAIRDHLQPIFALARERGWRITYDWTRSESWDVDLPHNQVARIECPRNLLGVSEADAVLWVVSDDQSSSGAPYEAGYARALGKPVAVLWIDYTDGTRCIYPWMAGACHWRAEDALETLETVVRKGHVVPCHEDDFQFPAVPRG